MSALKHLFSPITIRSMTLANRAVMPPMGTSLARDSMVTEANLAYMRRQASSGVGLVITEIAAVHPTGCYGSDQIAVYDDRFMPGLEKLARVVHEAGGKVALQLHHTGRENFFLLQEGKAIGPSAVRSLVYGMAPQEMSLDMIREVVASFGTAAARAQAAGFDAVEVHGAHGYLLTQFLSAISNRRKDEYGGSFRNRARFMIEVLEAVRGAVGEDFPVLLRVSAEEFIKTGYTVEEMQGILPDLVRAGADVIHASIGTHGSPGGITSAPPEYEPGFNAWRARRLKEAAEVPVIAVGRFTDPAEADQVIARGDADMVAFGRQQLADPDYLKKAREGRPEEIRKCIACNQGCIERVMFEPGKSIRCAINPETGQELIYPRGPSKKPRDVCVVGSGPAGLTTAYEGARLGHRVSLFEKEPRLGGNLFYASRAPHKDLFAGWLEWLIKQVRSMGVEIHTGVHVTGTLLKEGDWDFVVLATGSEKIIPEVPGGQMNHVHDAWQILDESVAVGKDVVVVGGGLVGMETADFCAERGARVTVIEKLDQSPVPKITSHGYMLHRRLKEKGCALLLGTSLAEIRSESVVVVKGGEEQVLTPTDQVIMAVGMKPCDDLSRALDTGGIPYRVVGDAVAVRRIIEATEEGARAIWDLG
ncbi:MAG: FAD-dependent oxidoreductase [Deltaproteobacteria bacterium]|nr:FAD-dependent oxidoreductase [Deltaproteobacteria bacterium]